VTERVPTFGLADLIRSNRHLVELRLAKPSEIAAVTTEFLAVGAIKGLIRHWQMIAIVDHKEATTSLHVVGLMMRTAWITSDVLRLTADGSFVRTRNSFYALGERAAFPPSIDILLTVAGALRAWGLDDRYGLDVVRGGELSGTGDA
jgi:hypothetical protein